MPDLTEYGDIMINAYMNEWGNRKIDGLLEDGTKIISAEAPPAGQQLFTLINQEDY